MGEKNIQQTRIQDGVEVLREDYDIALLRIDYPVVDPDTGMNVLNSTEFIPDKIMPICLPPNKDFKDTERRAVAVGMGMSGVQRSKCFTNGDGPDVFQQCSPRWVDPRMPEKDDYQQHQNVKKLCYKGPPPSEMNKICKKFHEKLSILMLGF